MLQLVILDRDVGIETVGSSFRKTDKWNFTHGEMAELAGVYPIV